MVAGTCECSAAVVNEEQFAAQVNTVLLLAGVRPQHNSPESHTLRAMLTRSASALVLANAQQPPLQQQDEAQQSELCIAVPSWR
jgi:hypothetical protein